VRNFEAFKELHVGMISEISPKSLPEIALGVDSKTDKVYIIFCGTLLGRFRRFERQGLIKQIIGERPMVLCIDETGMQRGENH